MKNSALKFLIILFCFFINVGFGYCQKMEELSNVKITDSIYSIVEQEAIFPGGNAALLKHIQHNLVFPDGYGDIDIVGKVYVRFVVRKTGFCTDFQLLRGIEDRKLESSVIDMLKKMPLWSPAKVKGKDVDSYYVLPVKICFE